MDEKTKILISLGAAVASNCIPCFEHYYNLAGTLGISNDQVAIVIEIAEKVKNGAGIATKQFTCDIMEGKESPVRCDTSVCCG